MKRSDGSDAMKKDDRKDGLSGETAWKNPAQSTLSKRETNQGQSSSNLYWTPHMREDAGKQNLGNFLSVGATYLVSTEN